MGQVAEARHMSVEIRHSETWIFLMEADVAEDFYVAGCEVAPVGSDRVDEAIVAHVRNSTSVSLSPRVAEAIKLALSGPGPALSIKGRDLTSDEPIIAQVARSDVHESALDALAPAIHRAAECQARWGLRDEQVQLEGPDALLPGLLQLLKRVRSSGATRSGRLDL